MKNNNDAILKKTGRLAKKELQKLFLAIFFSMVLSAIICVFSLALTNVGFKALDYIFTVLALWVVCTFIFFLMYQYVIYQKKFSYNVNKVTFLYSAIVITIFLSVFVAEKLSSYALPIILCTLLVSTMIERRYGFMANVVTSQITVFCYIMIQTINGQDNILLDSLPIIIAMLMGFGIVFFVKENYTRLKIVGLSVIVSVVGSILAMLCSMMAKNDWANVIIAGVWSLSGYFIAILLYVFLEPMMEWIFKLPTNLYLMELSDFNHPLLKELASKAPGTYSHCLSVGSCAEQCAYAIGENSVLAKVCGYYHDIGKIENPEYFSENQEGGHNPHDDLPFEMSVNMIIRHTEAGASILKKQGFPDEVVRIARTHHGNSSLKYFYLKAQSITEGEVDSTAYRYPNPKPSTKIEGIIMLCDCCEAAVRAVKPKTTEEMIAKIDEVVDDKVKDHQLDACPLTMKNISIIKNKLAEVLEGVFHNRIEYPDKK